MGWWASDSKVGELVKSGRVRIWTQYKDFSPSFSSCTNLVLGATLKPTAIVEGGEVDDRRLTENRRWFYNIGGSGSEAESSYDEAKSTTIVRGDKHRARLDLWVDEGIKSQAILRSVRRALTSDSEAATKW
ncbi:hypothetical protein U1Q18_019866 [Sarracenia purpurea var. burkii]